MEKQGYLITRGMVYGTETPEIPQGYEDTGEFRPPALRELYLNQASRKEHEAGTDFDCVYPRIILRKKRVRKVVFTQVGDGFVNPGCWYESFNGGIVKNLANGPTAHKYAIFTREEVFE